jgi:hypothetical protein
MTPDDNPKMLPRAEDDPRLLHVLHKAGEEWGPVQVALSAALIADPDEVAQALIAVRGFTGPLASWLDKANRRAFQAGWNHATAEWERRQRNEKRGEQ